MPSVAMRSAWLWKNSLGLAALRLLDDGLMLLVASSSRATRQQGRDQRQAPAHSDSGAARPSPKEHCLDAFLQPWGITLLSPHQRRSSAVV